VYTAEEFITAAQLSGYANKSAAEKYVERTKKEVYITQDFVELYHESMRWSGCAADKGLREVYGCNGKTTAINNIRGNSSGGQDWDF